MEGSIWEHSMKQGEQFQQNPFVTFIEKVEILAGQWRILIYNGLWNKSPHICLPLDISSPIYNTQPARNVDPSGGSTKTYAMKHPTQSINIFLRQVAKEVGRMEDRRQRSYRMHSV